MAAKKKPVQSAPPTPRRIERRRRKICIPMTPRTHETLRTLAEMAGVQEEQMAARVFELGLVQMRKKAREVSRL